MIPRLKKLLKQHDVTTLGELSKKLKVSLSVLKNISSNRTAFSSLSRRRTQHRVFPKQSENLAELIGVVLGDGNIFACRRCQRLTISCNSSYSRYTTHVKHLVKNIFKKEPSILKRSEAHCHDVRLYMQDIDKALGLPAGNKIKNKVEIPAWIFKRNEYVKKCLKGLFETDGCYGSNKKAHVEFIEFCNRSGSLRQSASKALMSLGYSPQVSNRYVRLARKDQVYRFIAEMDFERPFPSLKTGKA